VEKAGKPTGDPRDSSIIVTDGQTAGETQVTDHTDSTRLSRRKTTAFKTETPIEDVAKSGRAE
jgi:hypothetical protein